MHQLLLLESLNEVRGGDLDFLRLILAFSDAYRF
jgi:hypothetical protein